MPKPLWVYSIKSKRYRSTKTGRFISERQMLNMRDLYIEQQKDLTDELAQRLADGEINVQRWLLEMRDRVRNTYIDEYVMARGGRNIMTNADWGRIGAMVKNQYGYLQGFANDVKAGKLSLKQIKARSKQYIDSATQGFERARQLAFGAPDLPTYPADGSQDCGSNCKCHWDIRFDKNEQVWNCYWRLNPAAEHCDTCVGNAAEYNPLVIPAVEDVNRILDKISTGHNHAHNHENER